MPHMKWRVGHLHTCSPLGWPSTATLEVRGSESEESVMPRTASVLFTLPPVRQHENVSETQWELSLSGVHE